MGRKKIRITRITDDRNRSVTYLKRKAGLMKKAHELAVLTGSEVAVIVFGQNGKLSEFCSGDMDHLLLRYTDHKGPVERRGPENYQNDNDDDSNYDGGDYDEGDDDYDGSFGGASGAAGGQSGAGGDYSSYNGSSNNGANGGNSRENNSTDNANTSKGSTKRKAPRGKKMSDAQSVSSGSSRRSSSPFNNASTSTAGGPMIKIEEDNGVDRNTLKAAIIRNTLSKPRTDLEILQRINGSNPRPVGMQHHHSFSTPDFNFIPPQAQLNHFGQPRMSVPNMPNEMMPQRPSTAGAGQMPQTPFTVTQRQSPPRFAFNTPMDHQQSAAFAQQTQGHQFFSPTPVNFPSATPPPPPPGQQGMSSMQSATTYGDLARGGNLNHGGQSTLTVPGQPNMPGTHSHPVSPTSPNGVGPDSLLPLAHPILKQHPQFESYAQQWRTQQQRNASVPMIHTAPPSPNYAANGQQPLQLQIPGMSNMGNVGAGQSSSPISPLPPPQGFIKRSASFGVATSDSNGRLMAMDQQQQQQQQQQHSAPVQQHGFLNPFGGSSPGTNPMASGVEDANSLSTHSSLPPPPYAPMASSASSLPGNGDLGDSLNGEEMSGADIQQPISNAAFNDLMGSILGDIGSSGDVTNDDDDDDDGTTSGDQTLTSSKQEEDVMRSLDSDHSLSTLVSSESFDVLMANGGNIDGFGPRSDFKSDSHSHLHKHKSSIDKNADKTEGMVRSTTIDATQDAT